MPSRIEQVRTMRFDLHANTRDPRRLAGDHFPYAKRAIVGVQPVQFNARQSLSIETKQKSHGGRADAGADIHCTKRLTRLRAVALGQLAQHEIDFRRV
jgi:hypothetical protein